eukprot:CAMPEP_0119162694 /NCGR_PEP_ID=MMETSP1315-20130426/2703_1 /TAXON_ID=676789 /ORGANISM="Prasinoderma singularis, Strain RCC927" /LENGTH=251 /DNA_ID=CAMNT_0007155603 /DNA_START=62 /DNA_END=817 /DNA_ORIENTATION=-
MPFCFTLPEGVTRQDARRRISAGNAVPFDTDDHFEATCKVIKLNLGRGTIRAGLLPGAMVEMGLFDSTMLTKKKAVPCGCITMALSTFVLLEPTTPYMREAMAVADLEDVKQQRNMCATAMRTMFACGILVMEPMKECDPAVLVMGPDGKSTPPPPAAEVAAEAKKRAEYEKRLSKAFEIEGKQAMSSMVRLGMSKEDIPGYEAMSVVMRRMGNVAKPYCDTHFEPMIKKAFEDLAASEASAKRKMGGKKK